MEVGLILTLILFAGFVLYAALFLAWCTIERIKRIEAKQYQLQAMKYQSAMMNSCASAARSTPCSGTN